jgi:hypothetical protein
MQHVPAMNTCCPCSSAGRPCLAKRTHAENCLNLLDCPVWHCHACAGAAQSTPCCEVITAHRKAACWLDQSTTVLQAALMCKATPTCDEHLLPLQQCWQAPPGPLPATRRAPRPSAAVTQHFIRIFAECPLNAHAGAAAHNLLLSSRTYDNQPPCTPAVR